MEAATDSDGKSVNASFGGTLALAAPREAVCSGLPTLAKVRVAYGEPDPCCSLRLSRLEAGRTACLEACGPLLSTFGRGPLAGQSTRFVLLWRGPDGRPVTLF